MIRQGLTYEEHEVGATYETLGRTVTEADICAFVNLCGFNEPLFYDMEYVASAWPQLGNKAIGEAIHGNFEAADMPKWSEDEVRFAKEFQTSLGLKPVGLRTG